MNLLAIQFGHKEKPILDLGLPKRTKVLGRCPRDPRRARELCPFLTVVAMGETKISALITCQSLKVA
jgi:hypothetical protein